MLLSSYWSLAFAVGVQSFLIPGDVDALAKDVPKDDATPSLFGQSSEKELTLDCSTCPYALNSQRNGGHEWTNDVRSDLHLKIDAQGDSLRFNGVPFYPVQGTTPPLLHASQTKKNGEDPTFEGFPGDLRLSYSLEYNEKKADDGSVLLSVTMTIMALDGQMVKIDNVEIKAIKAKDGKLILHSASPVSPDPNSMDAQCSNVLCRIFAKMITGMKKAQAKVKQTCYNVKCLCYKCVKNIKGAWRHFHKKPASAPAPPAPVQDHTVKVPVHPKFRPGMFGGRRPHPNHPHHQPKTFFHRMGHIMWSTVKIAFMPILIGIAFGMAASAIGMLVGQAVVHLWMKYRKPEQRHVYIPVETDEKAGLPAYEDLPAQEAPAVKEDETTTTST